MADRVWGAGTGAGTNAKWSTAANWTGDTKPTTGDNVIFNNGVVLACTIDEATAELGNFTIGGTASGVYSGTITCTYKPQMTGNFVIESGSTAVFDLNADMDVDGDFTVDGGGTFDCGAGTITCAGNWDNKDQTTWTRGTSTVVLSGTEKTIIANQSKSCYDVTVSGSYTIDLTTTTGFYANHNLIVSGTLTATDYLYVGGDLSVSGTLNGGGNVYINTSFSSMTGTYSPGATVIRYTFTFTATGTFGGTFYLTPDSAATLTCGTGTRTFTGAVTFGHTTAGRTLTVDDSVNNPSWVFQGAVTVATGGTQTWTKGSGTITFSGTNDQTITTPAGWTGALEDIVVNKTSGSVKQVGNVFTDTFTLTDGDWDPNGNTLDSAGSVSVAAGARFWDVTNNDASLAAGSTIDIAAGTLTLQGAA